MISYELPLGIAVASVLLLSNSLSLRTIVETQSAFYGGFFPAWNLFQGCPSRRWLGSSSS